MNESKMPWVVGIIAILAVAACIIAVTITLGQAGARNGVIRERLATECIQQGHIWLDNPDRIGARGCLR